MTNPSPEPVAPEIKRLFEAERRAPAPAADVSERVRARVLRTVAATPGSPAPPRRSHLLAGASATALVVAGALWMARGRSLPPTQPTPAAPAREAPAPSPAVVAPPPEPVSPVMKVEPRAEATPVRRRSPGHSANLLEEQVLLEAGRRALAAGDGSRALAATREHERRWPAGALVHEREVLAILALERLGATAEARARAEAFLAKFATSTLAPRVRATLARLMPATAR